MAPRQPDRPATFPEVLREELKQVGKELTSPEAADPATDPAVALKAIYAELGRRADEKAPAALCFSGGGIRSATFNLGVLQALARLDLLRRFDYLSSVSGGGFIAGWFKAWANREGFDAAVKALKEGARASANPREPEPQPILHLRNFSNYLTPRTGLLSADTWTLVALTARNLFLNWLVLVPVLMCLIAIPQLSLIVAAARDEVPAWFRDAPYVGLGFGFFASASANYFRRRRDHPAREPVIVAWTLAPLWIAALCLSLGALWVNDDVLASGRFAGFCIVWAVVMPVLGWVVGAGVAHLARLRAARLDQERGRRPVPIDQGVTPAWLDLPAILIAGSATCATLVAVGHLWLRRLQGHPPIFVVVLVPLLLGLYLLSRTIFVALTSWRSTPRLSPEEVNADREWWARLSAWLLIAAAAWVVASALVVLGGFYFDRVTNRIVASLGGVTGVLTAVLGASTRTGGSRDGKPTGGAFWLDLGLKTLAPATVALVIIGLAALNGSIAGHFVRFEPSIPLTSLTDPLRLPAGTSLFWAMAAFAVVPLAAFLAAAVLGLFVNVNVFSAQGLYRNRLVRAYLGASNRQRRADPFTGFDPADNMPLQKVREGGTIRPLLVVNAALNLVRSEERLAWQERKAESFTMTPLFCGNSRLGYRPSSEYGGDRGISLGTAVTISGAAANPNAGYHTSPLVSFLMTLFNARLGSWLGNPGKPGARVYRRNGPRHAWRPLFGDLFGLTDSRQPYVSLSDGGHFENLGLYEMVLRRCRIIVVSDAGCDPWHTFEDLGNAVRKVRIDLGVPITFPGGIPILPRAPEGGAADDAGSAGKAEKHVAAVIGRIGYDAVDEGATPGCLIYLKPTLRADRCPVPRDILAYAEASPCFPHEPTSDQWFSESQFESYRALGEHLAAMTPPPGKWTAPDEACPLPKESPANPDSRPPVRPAPDAGPCAAPGA